MPLLLKWWRDRCLKAAFIKRYESRVVIRYQLIRGAYTLDAGRWNNHLREFNISMGSIGLPDTGFYAQRERERERMLMEIHFYLRNTDAECTSIRVRSGVNLKIPCDNLLLLF